MKITLKSKIKMGGFSYSFLPANAELQNITSICNTNDVNVVAIKSTNYTLKLSLSGNDEAIKKSINEIQNKYNEKFIIKT